MANPPEEITSARTGQKMIFRKTGNETNGHLLEIECFSPPSNYKEPEHIHPFQENIFELISGTVHFWVNGSQHTITAGETITIPKGIPHYFWNEGNMEAHYIQKFSPSLHIDQFFRTYFALTRENKVNKKGLPNLFLISIISLNHQNEIRLIKPPWAIQKFLFSLLAPIGKLMGYKAVYK
jgi:quercetin dioxygenase-like cupin family protein